MPTIRPLSEAEYVSWLTSAISTYAKDKTASGAWAEDTAMEQSHKEHRELLPDGKDTQDNYLYAIADASGRQVGILWFAVKQRAKTQVAYVYNIEVFEAHRSQGHAYRAFSDLESEVARLGLDGIALHVFGHNKVAQALYAKLGYEPTNINLYKSVRNSGA
jgi:ribosomal protein S18 acetylase RimI-like enzyme